RAPDHPGRHLLCRPRADEGNRREPAPGLQRAEHRLSFAGPALLRAARAAGYPLLLALPCRGGTLSPARRLDLGRDGSLVRSDARTGGRLRPFRAAGATASLGGVRAPERRSRLVRLSQLGGLTLHLGGRLLSRFRREDVLGGELLCPGISRRADCRRSSLRVEPGSTQFDVGAEER